MEEKLTELVAALVEPTHGEEKCINYDLHQGAEDSSELMFYENWRSQADLDRHLGTAHVKELLDQLPELSENGVEITLFEMVSAPAS